MISLLLIASLLVALTGMVMLKHALGRVPVGYQDEFGFHEGADPQNDVIFAIDERPSIAEVRQRSREARDLRQKRLLKRPLRTSIGHDSVAPFPY